MLTGFFLLSSSTLPLSSSLFPLPLGCNKAASWEDEGGKDGSSTCRESLPLGKPATDTGPHGLLTCCSCDLWRLEASVHCSLLSSRSFIPSTRTAGLQGAAHAASPSTGISKEEILAYAEHKDTSVNHTSYTATPPGTSPHCGTVTSNPIT